MEQARKRIKTGIDLLDDLAGGGILKESVFTLVGTCRLCKTVMALQFLYHGAEHYNEPGILITMEDSPKSVRRTMMQFGWDTADLENKGKLTIMDATEVLRNKDVLGSLIYRLSECVIEKEAARVVLDSTYPIMLATRSEEETARWMRSFFSMTRETSCTAFVISRNVADTYGRFGMEEIWSDGVLRLDSTPSEGVVRGAFSIVKMRDLPMLEQGKVYGIKVAAKGIDLLSE